MGPNKASGGFAEIEEQSTVEGVKQAVRHFTVFCSFSAFRPCISCISVSSIIECRRYKSEKTHPPGAIFKPRFPHNKEGYRVPNDASSERSFFGSDDFHSVEIPSNGKSTQGVLNLLPIEYGMLYRASLKVPQAANAYPRLNTPTRLVVFLSVMLVCSRRSLKKYANRKHP